MYFLLIGFVLAWSCKDASNRTETSAASEAASDYVMPALTVYDYEGLKPLLKTDSDKIYVVNFWATWCAPCIKELPYFEALDEKYDNKGVEVLLVSLDFPKKYDSHLKPFIKKHQLKSRVVAFDDMDSNTWIPDISPDWSGAIPATLIFSKTDRKFYERTFASYEELETELKSFLE